MWHEALTCKNWQQLSTGTSSWNTWLRAGWQDTSFPLDGQDIRDRICLWVVKRIGFLGFDQANSRAPKTTNLVPLSWYQLWQKKNWGSWNHGDTDITVDEVEAAVTLLKNGKATGLHFIPNEVIKKQSVLIWLYRLFQVCFENGLVP